jgi:hypothetical protein
MMVGARPAAVHDHLLVGPGIIEGADAHLESLAALWRLAPDLRIVVSFDSRASATGSSGPWGASVRFPKGAPSSALS